MRSPIETQPRFSRWLSALLLVNLFAVSAQAFIPPIPGIVREVFEGRKPKRGAEVVLHHHVEVRPGESVELEERAVSVGGRMRFLWRAIGQGVSVAGTWDRQGYQFGGDAGVASRSGVFLKYLLSSSSEELLSQLVGEGFVRREELQQFRGGWVPEGDPNTWDVKGNYIRHPDIFLRRLAHAIGIAVVGNGDSSGGKTVYFDQALKGIRRLEWQEGGRQVAWDFDGFFSSGKEGFYPRTLTLQTSGDEKVRSELLRVHSLSDREISEFNSAFARTARAQLPTNVEGALQVLLSYR